MEPARIYSGFEMTNPSLGSAKLIINQNVSIVGAVTLPMIDHNGQKGSTGFCKQGVRGSGLLSSYYLKDRT